MYPLNPGLGPLADNGGPTYTMALKGDSPCIDHGYSFGLNTDQRGVRRPVTWPGVPNVAGGDGSDIGAYEAVFNWVDWTNAISQYRFIGRFNSICGGTNIVQATSNIGSGTWTTWTNIVWIDPVGNGGIMEVDLTNSPGLSQQFYRIGTSVHGGFVPFVAFDSTIDLAYSNAWTSGSNGGRGFGPWVLMATSSNLSDDGFFLGSSTNNGTGASPGIDVNGSSWGMSANSNNLAVAYRAFTNSLAAGELVRVDMDNGYIDASNSVGVVLRNGNATNSPADYTAGVRLEFLYIGADVSNSYKVVDSGGVQNIGVPWTSTGLRLLFTLNTTNTYTLLTIDNASGATNTFTGTLTGSGTVDSIALFNNNAGANADHSAYFNTLETAGP
jgi:hypothetical protein